MVASLMPGGKEAGGGGGVVVVARRDGRSLLSVLALSSQSLSACVRAPLANGFLNSVAVQPPQLLGLRFEL